MASPLHPARMSSPATVEPEKVFDVLTEALKDPADFIDFDMPSSLKEWKLGYYTPIKRRGIATGDLNFLSIPIPSVDLTGEDASPTDSSTNQLGMVNPLSSTHDAGQPSNMHGQEAQPTASVSSGQKEEEPVKKIKQSQIAVVLNDYVDFKKQQSQKFMEEMKEPKQTYQFTIASCVAALETMEDLSIAEKSKVLRLFKCQLNREIFLNTKDPILRTFWLKEEISAMEKA